MNTVQLSGWLARDPEARYFESGSVVASTAIGIQEYKKNDDAKTNFVEVKAWGKTAEFMCQYLKKGSYLIATGRLEVETWEKDGNKRSKTVVVLDRVETPPKPKGDTPF